MATVVDALLVSVGLDAAGFIKGKKNLATSFKETRDDAIRTAKDMEAAGKNAAEFFVKIGAAFAGIKSIDGFISRTTEAGTSLHFLSQNLGMTVSDINALVKVAEQFGGSSSGMIGSLRSINELVQNWQVLHNPAVFQALWPVLGEGVSKFADKSTTAIERLEMLRQAVQKMGALEAGTKLKGIIDEGTLNVLIGAKKPMQDVLADMKKQNDFTDAQANKLNNLNKAWMGLQNNFEDFFKNLLVRLSPTLTEIINKFEQWIQKNKGFIETGIVKAVKDLSDFITSFNWDSFLQGLLSVLDGTGKLVDAFKELMGIAGGGRKGGMDAFRAQEAQMTQFANSKKTIDDQLTEIEARPWYRKTITEQLLIRSNQKHIEQEIANLAKSMVIPLSAKAEYSPEYLQTLIDFGAKWETSTDPASLTSSQRGAAQSDIAALMAKGWSREAAAGISAQFQAESSGDIHATGDYNKKTGLMDAYGLAQWHEDRRLNFIRQFGHDIYSSTREEQIAFADWELTKGPFSSVGAKLRNVKTASEAGSLLTTDWEIPADAAAKAIQRAALAQSLMGAAAPDRMMMSGAAPSAIGSAATIPNMHVNNTQAETHIGQIDVHTQATDANALARDLAPFMTRYNQATFADTGLTGG